MSCWVGGWTGGWMGGQMNEWMGGWVISCSAYLNEPEKKIKRVLKKMELEGHSTFPEGFFIGSLNR